jgi:hypothetical protein
MSNIRYYFAIAVKLCESELFQTALNPEQVFLSGRIHNVGPEKNFKILGLYFDEHLLS